jgi:methylated-DNA-[protein]-cysteine S-methyltransferase
MSYSFVESPIGKLLLTSDGSGLTGLYPETHVRLPKVSAGWQRQDGFFTGVRDQLDAWFSGRLTRFEVALTPLGTTFQHRVWDALRSIPFGATTTYQASAARLGQPGAARAVGLANARNPISLIVPCHRVIGANGKLTGYAGGVGLKQWLLDHEQVAQQRGPIVPFQQPLGPSLTAR